MTFNRIIITCILTLLSCTCMHGQKSALKVSYNYHFFTLRGYEVDRPMILIADAERSKFFNPMTNMIDSLNSTPEGRAKYEAMRPKVITSAELASVPTRWEKMYIEKNRPGGYVKQYDTIGDDRLYCMEMNESPEWCVGDSVRNILGYECVMAETDYHGRRWTVWFAPDIPIADGPWKLRALPGLILSAAEATGQYSFVADGVELYEGDVPPVYEEDLYKETSRKELLEYKRFFAENLGIIITAQTSVKGLRPGQLKSLELKTDLDFLETDYR